MYDLPESTDDCKKRNCSLCAYCMHGSIGNGMCSEYEMFDTIEKWNADYLLRLKMKVKKIMKITKKTIEVSTYAIELNYDEHSLLVSALGLAAIYSNGEICDEILRLRCGLIEGDNNV